MKNEKLKPHELVRVGAVNCQLSIINCQLLSSALRGVRGIQLFGVGHLGG